MNSSFQDTTFNFDLKRVKRASHRGQTQSHYLSFGSDDDGKAEAEATNVSYDSQLVKRKKKL